MKRTLAIILSLLMIAAVSAGCGKQVVSSGKTDVTATQAKETQDNKEGETVSYEAKSTDALLNINDVPAADLNAANAEYQKKAAEKGEEVATLHTNYGDISIKFFPEVAPKAVYSFKALAKAGRYDGTIFHRVIKNFMIQGGDYTKFNGTGGESAYGQDFDLEVSDYLSNIEGAVAMANRGPGTNGSQFYINQVNNNYLDGSYTVFAQVIDGMDVVNKIAQVATNSSDKPVKDVILQSVKLHNYE
ncbi:peptidylprolyl isomerase [Ruminococcus sp.]|uniref:peptidylprolyl isomerase n=1 Tax=Ruminococcus sp. TaxID=41978 RepID=UPI00388EDFCD